jgi:CubicO group peptidase (beta-lactamase class C family)
MEIVRPESVGFSAQRLNRLVPLMQEYVDVGKSPGLVLMIARRGQIAFAEACGVMDISNHQPMPLDGIFRLASQTKPVTAAAAMILYQDGRFQLSDPVAKYLPEFSHSKVYTGFENGKIQLVDVDRPITVEHLFTHHSGLVPIKGQYPVDDELQKLYDAAGLYDPLDSLREMVSRIAALPLHVQPGAAWRYQCSSDVLARLVEVIAAMPFAEFLQQRIFEPLGMADTGYFVPPEKADRLVRAYNLSASGALEDLGEEERNNCFKPPRLTEGSGGLLSTTMDYQRFAQMLANGGQLGGGHILDRKTVEFMAANRLRADELPFWPFPNASMAGYGFGLGVRVLMDPTQLGIPSSVGEFGWSGWYNTGVWIDPAEKLSGVLMAQVAPPGFWPHIPPLEVRRIVYQAIDD